MNSGTNDDDVVDGNNDGEKVRKRKREIIQQTCSGCSVNSFFFFFRSRGMKVLDRTYENCVYLPICVCVGSKTKKEMFFFVAEKNLRGQTMYAMVRMCMVRLNRLQERSVYVARNSHRSFCSVGKNLVSLFCNNEAILSCLCNFSDSFLKPGGGLDDDFEYRKLMNRNDN